MVPCTKLYQSLSHIYMCKQHDKMYAYIKTLMLTKKTKITKKKKKKESLVKKGFLKHFSPVQRLYMLFHSHNNLHLSGLFCHVPQGQLKIKIHHSLLMDFFQIFACVTNATIHGHRSIVNIRFIRPSTPCILDGCCYKGEKAEK